MNRSLLLLLAICSLGCSQRPVPSDQAKASVPSTAGASQNQVNPGPNTLASLELSIQGSSNPEVVSKSPDEAIISSTVRRLDWNSPQAVYLTRDSRSSFQIKGSLNPQSPDDRLMAYLDEEGKDGTYADLPSLDVAVALMVSFAEDDGKWRDLVEWKAAE